MIRTVIILTAALSCANVPAQQRMPTGSQHATSSAPKYDLKIKLIPSDHRLEVVGTVWLPPADQVRHSLQLDLSDVMHDLQVHVVQPLESAGPARMEKTTATRWTLYPRRPLGKGEATLLRFSYSGGEKIAFVFYIGSDGSFASGINTAWYPQVDKARGVGSLSFSVPGGYKVFCVGTERETPEEAAAGNYRFQIETP